MSPLKLLKNANVPLLTKISFIKLLICLKKKSKKILNKISYKKTKNIKKVKNKKIKTGFF
jgi:hypothetical protein